MTLDEALAAIKGYEMSPAEKRAQRISFAVGNLMCMSKYRYMTQAERDDAEWEMRRRIAKGSP